MCVSTITQTKPVFSSLVLGVMFRTLSLKRTCTCAEMSPTRRSFEITFSFANLMRFSVIAAGIIMIDQI